MDIHLGMKTMNNLFLLLYPGINVIVTGLFAGIVLRQYVQRHRLYQLYWGIALSMAFVATLAYVFMIVVQPASDTGVLFFRLYYILGAALMPSWLGLGSVALVARAHITRICLVVLCVLSILAALLISMAGVDRQQLGHIAGTPGAGILQPQLGAWLITIIVLNTLGVLAVVGVAIYSGWKLIQRQGTSSFLWANFLILAGDLINAAAGTTVRLGVKNIFLLVITFVRIFYSISVLIASRQRSYSVTSNREGQE